ncbi:DUF748 domain-containing protein [Denitrificimonas sp. JX-1]|uniref:DUF748 domain-containing protein n=1 Tax=Denitrificimonas halotolerans TaxID=3098930 RepID=A0ABU5GP57_9GAMM|nr:DUF748 domain-containing protein [Denitrificimonas sp. JX-1]MDY7218784.1 DUF748 domain-containing protein [Denitrificimonas sp. JX-1]
MMLKALKRLVIILTSVLAVYSWLGFLLIPSVALHIANQQLGIYATQPAHLHRLEFNPFRFELKAWGFQLGEAEDQQLSLQHLYGKLALDFDSLRNKSLRIEDILLVKPHGQVIINPKGELNLTQLFNLPDNPEPKKEPDSTPLTLLIDRIQLQDGQIRFNDQRQQDPVDVTLADLNITLNNFDTGPDNNSGLQLSAQASDGAHLQWQGDVSINPVSSQGQLSLTGAQLKSWWPYVREHFDAQLQDGQLNLSTDYTLVLQPTLQFTANNLSAELKALGLNHNKQPLARLGQLSIQDGAFDLAAQKITLGTVTSRNLEAWADIDQNGTVNWLKPLPQKAEPDTPEASNSAWHIIVKQADLKQHTFHLADNSRAQPVALEVADFNLRIKDFDSLAEQPFSAELNTGIGQEGKISSQAKVRLQPLNVEMTVNSSNLDLRPAQSWISPYAHVELRSGLLNSALNLHISDPEHLKLNVSGQASITQLHVTDTFGQRDLAKWHSVDVNGISYSLQEQKLNIDQVVLDQPYVRFIINDDLSTNISQLMIEQPQSASAEPTPTDGPEFAMRIGGIEVQDGSANFADYSLTPNFATAIQKLNGHIGTLNNQTNAVAEVDIQGSIDRYAPVSITGSLKPFDPLKKLDIATSFKHVELTTLTPYSGKFAGYRIQKGRLNLDLHYKITDGKLDATNQLLLEELQLGERVDSPDAVDLPIRLAIALLKDRKGQIAIDLPVQGDLNNPEFSVAPIIWQTLRNLITRAAAAPFNFIAGLVDGKSDELNEVAFPPGQATITASAAKSLNALAAALKDRPELRLEVEGGSLAQLDGPVLAEARLTAAYQDVWYSMLQRRGSKIEERQEDLQVPEKEQAALLEGIYRAVIQHQPPSDWDQLKKDERSEKMRTAVLKAYAQDDTALRLLAQKRANSIKEYLIENSGLEAQRVYLIDVSLGTATQKNEVISKLHLGAM